MSHGFISAVSITIGPRYTSRYYTSERDSGVEAVGLHDLALA